VLTLWRFPYSTNVERVVLALAHKGLDHASEWVDPADRSPVVALSGQPLVPVLVDDGAVVADSTRILEHLERRFPDPPLFPRDPARAAEVRVFADWFNRVWKVAPNRLADGGPDPALEAELRSHQDVFEALLTGRGHLFGDYGAADMLAWPFLRYAVDREPGDTDPFHQVLRDHLSLERRPNLAAWVERVAQRLPAA
jgi:glutathione S-transferase